MQHYRTQQHYRMLYKIVTRSLLLIYTGPISSDQLVELYYRKAEDAVAIYSKMFSSYVHCCVEG